MRYSGRVVKKSKRSLVKRAGMSALAAGAGYLVGGPYGAIKAGLTEAFHNPVESVKTAVGNDTAQSTRGVAVVTHRKKKLHPPKGKKVKVSRLFSRKVEKALEKKGVILHGSFRQFSTSQVVCNIANFPEGGQYVFIPGKYNTGNFFNNDAWGGIGNVSQYVHMLSVLWNGKADNQGTRDIYSSNSLGSVNISGVGQPNASNTAHSNNLQFTVKNHYEIYRFKNNGQRTIILKAYLCKAKSPTSENPSAFNDTTGTAGVLPSISDPFTTWLNGQSAMNNEGIAVNTGFGPQSIYASPLMNPNFNKYWVAEEAHYVVEPGQTFEYKVQGPRDLGINCADCWQGTYFMDVQKFTLFPMFVAHLDMVYGATNGLATRAGGGTHMLDCEREIFCSFECPNQVGGVRQDYVIVAPSDNRTVLNNRVNRFYYKYWVPGATGNLTRVDEENPQGKETI